MKATLSPDGATATLQIDGSFTAHELQQLLHTLGELRANMAPSVAIDPLSEAASDASGSIQTDPHVQVAVTRDGTVRYWLRSIGLGWMAFDLPAEKARRLADYVVAKTAPVASLFGEQGSNSGNPQ